jgi:hypothetical protein
MAGNSEAKSMAKIIFGWIPAMLLISFVIVFFLFFYDKGGNIKEQAVSKTESLEAMKFNAFDNKSVTGTEVINAAIEYKNVPQFSIVIKTGANKSGFYALNTSSDSPVAYAPPSSGNVLGAAGSVSPSAMVDVNKMRDESNVQNYVNTSALFKSKIFRDDNGAVRLIEFTQK